MPWRAVALGTTTIELAGYSPKRRTLTVQHNGTANIAYSQDPSNVLTFGFILAPGQTVTFNREDGDEPEREVYGVSTLGVQDIRVEESVGEVPALPVTVLPG